MPHEENRVESIFLSALELNPARRAAWLDEECGLDTELRRRVEALLKASEDPGSLLDVPPPGLAPAPNIDRTPIESPGTTIGNYKLLQQIGEGGFGVVYMAQQEKPVSRRVALKIIKPGMDSKQVIARFETERQALAMMDHPCIATVLDAGTTNIGRPYFVMELVNGISITKFCDDQRLSLRNRLGLFISICHAVQHAHQKGVIHRDIKPSNLLVSQYDGEPVPKVIDFGVAKAIHQRLTDKTMFTHFGQVIGTLQYMSPEQAELNQLDVDTRSDIFSLGAVLYELLTGSTPLDRERFSKCALDEVLRLIRDDDPPRPSVRLSSSTELAVISAQRDIDPVKLSRKVRGDLDWIVTKALDKNRSRRYQTANALAQDIERYLDNEPVLATPPTATYQLRKFAGKHRQALSAVTALALILSLATVVSTWQAIRASRLAEALKKSEVQAKAESDRAQIAEGAASKQARDSVTRLVRSHLDAGTRHMNQENYPEAALHFAEALRIDPDAQQVQSHRTRVATTLQKCVKPVRLWRAGKSASRLEVSGNGQYLVAYEGESLVRSQSREPAHVWEIGTGQLIMTLSHEGTIVHVSIGPNNRYVATASDDRTVKLWDLASRKQVGPTLEHDFFVANIEFSPSGDRIVTSTGKLDAVNKAERELRDQSVTTVWTVPDGNPICRIPHTDFVRAAKFQPDGKLIATVAADSTARLWDAFSGEPTTEALIHRTPGGGPVFLGLHGLEFSPDGKSLVTWSGVEAAGVRLSGHAWIWNVESGKLLRDPLVGRLCSISPDGNQLLTSGVNAVFLHRIDGNARLSLPLQTRGVSYAAFDPFGRHVATNDIDTNTVEVWETQYRQRRFAPLCHNTIVQSIQFVDERKLVTLDAQEQIRVWDLATAQQPSRHEPVPASAPSTPKTESPWIAQFHGQANLSSLVAGKRIESLLTLRGDCECVLSPDEKRMLVYSSVKGDRARSQMWDLSSREMLFTVEHDGFQRIQSAAFSWDGRYFATAASGISDHDQNFVGEARIWNAATGQPVSPQLEHNSAVAHVAFSRDGSRIVTGTGVTRDLRQPRNGEARVWAVPTGQSVTSALRHDGNVVWASFSPDGRKIVATSHHLSQAQCSVVIWDIHKEEAELTLIYEDKVRRAEFLADGSRIVTLASDVARILNAVSGEPLSPPLRTPISSWPPSNLLQTAQLLYVNSSHYAQLWDAQTGYPVTAPMNVDSGTTRATGGTLSADADAVFTNEEKGIQIWPITRDQRPIPEILKTAQLLAGYKIDDVSGLMPLTAKESQQIWQELNAPPAEAWPPTAAQTQNWIRRAARWHEDATEIEASRGNWTRIIAHAGRVIQLVPSDKIRIAAAYNTRGNAYAELGNFEQAALDLNESLRFRGSLSVQQLLAFAYLGQGRIDEYRRQCAGMLDELEATAPSNRSGEAVLVARPSTATADTFSNWSRLLASTSNTQPNAVSERTKAAVLCRAGKYNEALNAFTKISKPDLQAVDYLFQAIANLRLENQEQASQDENEADSLFERQAYIDWQDRLRIRLLKAEIESLSVRD